MQLGKHTPKRKGGLAFELSIDCSFSETLNSEYSQNSGLDPRGGD